MNHIEGLMRRFTIRLRMWGAIGIVLGLLALVGAAGTVGLLQLDRVNQRFAVEISQRGDGLSRLRTHMGDLRRYEKDMVISYEKTEQVIEYRDKWRSTVEKARAQIDALLAQETGDNVDLLKAMRKNVDDYVAAAEPVVRQLEASGYDNATVANRVLGRAKEAIRASEKQLAELNERLQTATAQAQADGKATTQRTFWIFGAALAIAMVMVVPLTLANMVSICRPLDASRRLAQAIAAGDLSTTLTVRGSDETATLQQALLEMQRSLMQIVGQVRDSADSINTASAEVASGNGDLSQRTEAAAGSLQQTASSMEQLTATVRQSADAARQASELAHSATQVAAHGGSVVAQVVTTMQDINTSSRKIADIIGTIDGIAFQTNILALNAAVEAARAGEQGRGFAVVASEVRSLAQRSAEAAREIKALIGASVDKVETGTRQVADAGSTMGDIVASVRRVSDIISEISAAAGEQSSGIGQVNGAVAQLDQSTQQNAALVEQSTAAAESLREEASRLAQVVATFKLQSA